MPQSLPTRLPLGATPHRLPFERRLRLWLCLLAAPTLTSVTALAYVVTHSLSITLLVAISLAIVSVLVITLLFDQITRPLQTLANVIAALREDDFSFRARGARRGDSLGDLALEINALAGTLQLQRSSALDALALVQRVLTSMQSPVLAFDRGTHLRLLNPAAAHAFHLPDPAALGQTAADLNLQLLLDLPDQGLYAPQTLPAPAPASLPMPTRWSVRRTTFRLHGVPHTLFVLTDVSSALREEERLAWQRLIRVLGHEINNSLTPIKSIAGSLRSYLPTLTPPATAPLRPQIIELPASALNLAHLDRGLAIIEDRSDSLNRFLQAYQRLSRLPAPDLRPTPLASLAQRVAALETRLPIHIPQQSDLHVLADPDQLQQLLINLLRNAVDAALSTPSIVSDSFSHPARSTPPSLPWERDDADRPGPLSSTHQPEVTFTWHATPTTAILSILDNGPGLTNSANLFVPFYTTKPGGSGIGLVLAQQIVSGHGGTLTLTNRPDHVGCQAEVRLPLALEALKKAP